MYTALRESIKDYNDRNLLEMAYKDDVLYLVNHKKETIKISNMLKIE